MIISNKKDILKIIQEVLNNNSSSKPYNHNSNNNIKNPDYKKIMERVLLVNHEMDHESVVIIIITAMA